MLFILKRVKYAQCPRMKNLKRVPRVRIELTAFRLLVFVWLWDWRATYCATEAHESKKNNDISPLKNVSSETSPWSKHEVFHMREAQKLQWKSIKSLPQLVNDVFHSLASLVHVIRLQRVLPTIIYIILCKAQNENLHQNIKHVWEIWPTFTIQEFCYFISQ